MDKVSVIIPTYNRRGIISRAIDSVYSQTYKNIEIIVIDDGSTDETSSFLRSKYPNITLLRTNNEGVAFARNKGINASTGKYVAFLDSDDYWCPEKISKQINSFLDNDKIGMNIVENDLLTEEGILIKPYDKKNRLFNNESLVCNIFKNSGVATPCVMVKRSVLDDVGLFNTNLKVGEDDNLWMRITSVYSVSFIDESLAIIDVRKSGLSRGNMASENLLSAAKQSILIIQSDYPLIKESVQHLFSQKLRDATFSHAYFLQKKHDHFNSSVLFFRCLRIQPSKRILVHLLYNFSLFIYSFIKKT